MQRISSERASMPREWAKCVLIVDDHPMTCEGLKTLLQSCYPAMTVETQGGIDGLGQAKAPWDFIFLDMHLPGVHFAHLLEELGPLLSRVILISANPEPEIVEQARARGACGLLLKNADADQLIDGFRRIQAGERVFNDSTDGCERANGGRLSPRRQEIFDALIGGLSNKQIARKLGISEYTVKDHVTAVLSTYGVRNRLELLLQQRGSAN